eukprot:GHVS01083570.1.p1 GENE.GHVS01083570.1~~GHVS01083570.1.p1  ORF type:complete len:223 (+),score=12.59 GHVS01083570.1:151-819(+)
MAQAVSIDCEFVTTRAGKAVASVCVVDEDLQTLLLSYVKPESRIIDYKTEYSGIIPNNMECAPTLASGIRSEVSRHIRGRLIVGQDVQRDLRLLGVRYKEKRIRNTAMLPRFLDSSGNKRKLKDLALEFLGESIQDGSHSAAEDARAAMKLYIEFWDLPGPAPTPKRALQVQAPAKRPAGTSRTCRMCGGDGHTQSSCPSFQQESERLPWDYDRAKNGIWSD